jgi:hypothetical protein
MTNLDGKINRYDLSPALFNKDNNKLIVPPCGIPKIQLLVDKIIRYINNDGWLVSYADAQCILANKDILPAHPFYQALIDEAYFVKKNSELAGELFNKYVKGLEKSGAKIIQDKNNYSENIIFYNIAYNNLKFDISLGIMEQVILIGLPIDRFGNIRTADLKIVKQLFENFAKEHGYKLIDLHQDSPFSIGLAYNTFGKTAEAVGGN